MMNKTLWKTALGATLGLSLWQGGAMAAGAFVDPTTIVVLPYYVEEGMDAKDAGNVKRHYRRMSKFINNQLVRHNFEVINPYAYEYSESEMNEIMERPRSDSILNAQEMTRKYNADVAYIVWLDVRKEMVDGYCKVKASIEGEGYDSAGRDLGVGVAKRKTFTKRDCEDAIIDAEKEVADEVGRRLTAWSGAKTSRRVSSSRASYAGGEGMSERGGGAIQRHADAFANKFTVVLESPTDYDTVEVFGKVVSTARGVIMARQTNARLLPDQPQRSRASWTVRAEGNDPFRLQANIVKLLNDISDSGGEVNLRGAPYRYTAAEVDLLKGIRTIDATSRSIRFIVDRERARDKEFELRHDPYEARERGVGYPDFD